MNYRLSAKASTALELVGLRGSVDAITTVLYNGVKRMMGNAPRRGVGLLFSKPHHFP